MATSMPQYQTDENGVSWHCQLLEVVHGAHKGRMCYNDDDEIAFLSEYDEWELEDLKSANVKFEEFTTEDLECGEENRGPFVQCEIVYFGFPLMSECCSIPREFLRPATYAAARDRLNKISVIVLRWHHKIEPEISCYDASDIVHLMEEKELIVSQMQPSKDEQTVKGRKVFLCHATPDKQLVLKVHNELEFSGHYPWIDLIEIAPGDSIVQKISEATESADALLLFISHSSSKSGWVKREWSSVLSRHIPKGRPKIIPLLIDDCEIPSLLSDIRYIDFRNDYYNAVDELLKSLDKI